MTTESKFFIGIGALTMATVVAGVILLGKQKPKSSPPQTLGTASQYELIANSKHTIGDINAPVKVVEFSDFQCPACKAAHPIIKNILKTKGADVYFVYRHYPLPTHKNSKVAAQAAEAAGSQGKFFEMHDLLFENQKNWENAGNAKEIFESYARQLELDIEKYNQDFDNVIGFVNEDFALGNKSGVSSTPTFFINGQKYSGVIQLNQFEQIIDSQIGKSTPESTQSSQ